MCLVAVLLGGGPITAYAELVDLTPTLLLDTQTGLKWLDLRETDHLSYSAVMSQTVPGGQLGGFRHATVQEVQTLWQSAGIPDITDGSSHANYAPVTDLIVRLGWPVGNTDWTPNGWAGIQGLTGTPSPRYPNAYVGTVLGYRSWDRLGSVSIQPEYYLNHIGDNFDGGHWLVMDAAGQVPEPSSMLLLVSGLAGLVAKRRLTKPQMEQ